MIEKESPFKAVDKSNNNSTTKQLVSECFLLSNHDSLLSSFETFNKIQSSKTKTKFQQGNIKTKYHILFQQFYIQIRNTLNIPLYISVERENLDSNFNSVKSYKAVDVMLRTNSLCCSGHFVSIKRATEYYLNLLVKIIQPFLFVLITN
jgi:hypothetical protein